MRPSFSIAIASIAVATIMACTHAHAQTASSPERRALCKTNMYWVIEGKVKSNINPEAINRICGLTPDEALPISPPQNDGKMYGTEQQELRNVLRGMGGGW